MIISVLLITETSEQLKFEIPQANNKKLIPSIICSPSGTAKPHQSGN